MAVDGLINVPIARTSLTENEIGSVLEPLRSGWLVQGPKVKEFEEKWSKFTGAAYSIATTSCTASMSLCLAAKSLAPQDEVIVPAFTWVATANVVEHFGAKVVFCDIDPNTFNLKVEDLAKLITKRTKGIIAVHLFGMPADMVGINAVAEANDLWVLEDAACGFGAYLSNAHVGNFGFAGCFSFHPRKAITTGEGGMITTNDPDLAVKVTALRDHGAAVSDLQRHLGPKPHILADHIEAGYNFRMTDIQAALGSAQMDRGADIVAERRDIAARYYEALKDINWLSLPASDNNVSHGFQSFPCMFNPEKVSLHNVEKLNLRRNKWMDDLLNLGISTRPATHAVHMLAYYKNKYRLKPEDFPNAYIANDCSLSIPLFNGMKSKEQNYVIDKIRSFTP